MFATLAISSSSPPISSNTIDLQMDESPVISRIPKTSVDGYSNNNTSNNACNPYGNSIDVNAPSVYSHKRPHPSASASAYDCNQRVVIDLRSDESQEPIVAPARSCPPPTRKFIDLAASSPEGADEDEIFVGTAEFTNFARDAYQRKKKRDKKVRRDSRSKKQQRSKSKHPRKVKIRGTKFKRKYHAVDRRYYYVQKGAEQSMSWNPWADVGEVAPWMTPGQTYWERGWDEQRSRFYYYSPRDRVSQYERPGGYLSPEPIECDSVDEERTPQAHPPIINTTTTNNRHTAPPLSRSASSPSQQAPPPIWGAPPRKKHRTASPTATSRITNLNPLNSRRHQPFNAHEGGFSFFDVPTTTTSTTTTTSSSSSRELTSNSNLASTAPAMSSPPTQPQSELSRHSSSQPHSSAPHSSQSSSSSENEYPVPTLDAAVDDHRMVQAVHALTGIFRGGGGHLLRDLSPPSKSKSEIENNASPSCSQSSASTMMSPPMTRSQSVGSLEPSHTPSHPKTPTSKSDKHESACVDIASAIWKILEPKVREHPTIVFDELVETHTHGSHLHRNVRDGLRARYNQCVVDIFQQRNNEQHMFSMDLNNGLGDDAAPREECENARQQQDEESGRKKTEWTLFCENLCSQYASQNLKALEFVKRVYSDAAHDEFVERQAKCMSILAQNKHHLKRILVADRRKGGKATVPLTEILTLVLQQYKSAAAANKKLEKEKEEEEEEEDDNDADVLLTAFDFEFMCAYVPALIRYESRNSVALDMIVQLSSFCVVYQLCFALFIDEILTRWKILDYIKEQKNLSLYVSMSKKPPTNKRKRKRSDMEREDGADDTIEYQRVCACMKLAMEVLKVLQIVTLPMEAYYARYGAMTVLQEKCIEAIRHDRDHYLSHDFALDALYDKLSGVLKYNLETPSEWNLRIFQLCCQILSNTLSVHEAMIFNVLSLKYKRNKRMIYFLHKTYTDLSGQKNADIFNVIHCAQPKTRSAGTALYEQLENDELEPDDPKKNVNVVTQPYAFRDFLDASFTPYNFQLDVTQREDAVKLSNIDCRESIADILLKYVQVFASFDERHGELQRKYASFAGSVSARAHANEYRYLIGTLFHHMLCFSNPVKVSWGYNKALNHYHRDNICIEWMKAELLYQHRLYGREEPDQNNQPQRHFRICALIEILFDALIWDDKFQENENNKCWASLLQRICKFCIEYQERAKTPLSTWKKVMEQQHSSSAEAASLTTASSSSDDAKLATLHALMSSVWNEVIAKCKQIQHKQKQGVHLDKCDLIFCECFYNLIHEDCDCVDGTNTATQSDKTGTESKFTNDELKRLCVKFEELIRSHRRRAISSRGGNVDKLNSVVVRSNTLHLLVGLTQMEATSMSTRSCARRSIGEVVWSLNSTHKKLLKLSQMPFLPTINYQYNDYAQHLQQKEYEKHKRILVVGDGNLSFGRALARLFGEPGTKHKLQKLKKNNLTLETSNYGARNVTVTCYESAMELLARYPHSGSVVNEIVDRGGFVLYGIDATQLKKTLSASFATYGGDKRSFPVFSNIDTDFKFDIIIWNFPHAMDHSYHPDINGSLVENFFVSAKEILAANGEIHVTLHINHTIDGYSDRQFRQFTTWSIGPRAEAQHLKCVKNLELKHRLFPGYAIKNVQGNPFNIVKAETYIFKSEEYC